MALTPTTRLQRVPSQSSSVLGNETIVLNYEIGNYYELNELGGFIWSLLEDQKVISVEEIKEKVLEEFEVEESVCEQELTSFLESLLDEKLIETKS
ncbi:PqqD family peptide modification chaperone [Spirosoma endbachense]|uniref:PqqD family peptide modification chaperone n=1 Tax=Spirosoma endbachense TaxID=2666025 RepID=A0A6P1VQI7_9BACT|nr:PqqD family peptide modification chaperone [Spirosoma endbachense]QHV94874.1 PqqD family peptide modification chaperone [Spirosoma endbachense]